MTVWRSQLDDRRLRAPREDRTALVDPPYDEIGALVCRSVELRAQYDYDFHGRSLAELSRQARADLLREGRRWTAAYRDVGSSSTDAAGLIFLAGHQPQVFHPGVWLKNFALGHLARRHGAVAVNLLIDGDTCKDAALRVPGGSVAEPHVETIPFDRPEAKIPYEERPIVDRDLFAGFGRRVARHIAALVPDPLIDTYWPLVERRMRQTGNLGECLAQARHQLEGEWGLETLEIPQSRVCQSEAFCWFVVHLLRRIAELREIYNDVVQQYRRVHRLRGTAHPVGELSADGPWLEAPLWIFSRDNPRRRPLFVRSQRDRLVLCDRQGLEIVLPLRAEGDAAAAVERLMELPLGGVKIRSRALITTLWARLVLGDLFIHGIGGAKYDQLTDLLIQRFFAMQPPGLMVLSATLHLPVERPQVSVEQYRAIVQQLRQLTYHPETYIGGANSGPSGVSQVPIELMADKARWIQTPQTPKNARTRCRAIRRINEALQPWVDAQRKQLEGLQAETARKLQAQHVLAWREYGFCLYPEKTVREFLAELLPKAG